MSSVHEQLQVRPMTLEDLPAVQVVEREAFESGWPATAFEHELTNNGMARYLVLERLSPTEPGIIGFAGLWLVVDQAHVVTVAVRPGERRHGYGRVLVQALVELAREHGMNDATLEVRVSNEAARGLYRVYGFHEVGERKRYYADNGEDAVIMTTEGLTTDGYRARLDGLEAELSSRFPGAIAGLGERG